MTAPSPSSTRTAPAPVPSVVRIRAFAILTGLTTVAIFLQAVTAGEFVSQRGRDSWVDIHGAVADAAWGLALITAVFAVIVLRRYAPAVTWLSVALFVLTLGQTGIGHLITDVHQDGWIPIHVPLAFVVFALTIWLSVQSARLRRRADASRSGT